MQQHYGIPDGYYFVAWASGRGIAAIKGTDPAQIKVIRDAFKACMEDEDFKILAKNAGILLNYIGTAEFKTFVAEQDKLYEDIVKSNKLGDRCQY